jgi:RNA polymerase sigma-70 factor, ECF subfamily
MRGFGKSKEKQWRDFEEEAIPFMPDLFRIAMWLVRNKTEAEDLVQETFIQALKSFHRYELGTNCKAWMTKIMYHLNGKRKRKLGQMQLVQDTEERLAETLIFAPPVAQKLTDEEIIGALKKVPENFREVVVLADVEDFAYKEIAKVLDVPIGTVMSRLHRGRKILRGELAVYAKEFGINIEDEKKRNAV